MKKIMWKYSKRTIRLCLRAVEVTLSLMAVLFCLVFWRLSVSPVNMDFLLPDLKKYFMPSHLPITIDVESIELSASLQTDGLFHLQIKDLSVLREDGTLISDFPDIELSYGLWRVITFNYMPDTLTVKNALLQGIIDADGNFYIQNKDDRVREVEPAPVKVSDFESIIRYLIQFERLELEQAQMVLDDQRQQKQYSIPRLDLLLDHDVMYEHALHIDADVLAQDTKMHVSAQALLNGRTRQMPFEINFEHVDVSKVGHFIPVVNQAYLTISGDIFGHLDLTKTDKSVRHIVKELSFQIKNEKKGTLSLPAPLTNEYNIDSVLLQGAFSTNLSDLKIDKSVVKTGHVTADLKVEIAGLGSFLDTGDISHIKTVLKSRVKNATAKDVPSLWPSGVGTTAHTWVRQNLSDGKLTSADFTLYFSGDELVDLFGDIRTTGMTVDYLNPMPPVKNVTATVHLYPDRVDIFATKGVLDGIQLTKADVLLTELDKEESHADISISANGPVSDIMSLIDSQPLGFAELFQLDPKETGGTGSVQTKLQFPLIDSLDVDQVKVQVEADIQQGKFPTPLSGTSITQGDFHLTVNNQQLTLNGTGQIHKIPLNLQWTENFDKTNSSHIQSEYKLQGHVDEKTLKSLWSDAPLYVKGPIGGEVVIRKDFSEKTMVVADIDLIKSMVMIYPIATTKDAGKPANISIKTDMMGMKQPTHVDVSVSAPDIPININGSVSWDNGVSIALDKVVAPQNDFMAYLAIDKKDNVSVKVKGKTWNLSELFDMPFLKKNDEVSKQIKPDKHTIANVQIVPPQIDLDVNLDKAIFVVDKPLSHIQISGKRQGYMWDSLNISATGKENFVLDYIAQKKMLVGECADLGDILSRLNLTERMIGGSLKVEAEQNNAGIFKGDIKIRHFDLKDTGFLMQAITVLGIVDGIRGKELHFDRAKIPFELTPYHNIYINNGHTYGTSLGITFNGRISSEMMDLKGQVIPAYFLNSLPGKIPVIGNLFKDGEKGGLVGVRYEIMGPLLNPQVKFNPLKSMMPGILGSFFD